MSGTLESLSNSEGTLSDHWIAHAKAEMFRVAPFQWKTYTYRHFSKKAVDKFKEWIVLHPWQEVLEMNGSDAKAEVTVAAAIAEFFPLRKRRRKTTDLMWMNSRNTAANCGQEVAFLAGRRGENGEMEGSKEALR